MAFVSEMVDQLRALLNDPADAQVSFLNKKLYLNRGIARLWPHIWRSVSITITPTAATTFDYTITVPWSAAAEYKVLSVEVADSDGNRTRFADYDIIPGDEDLTAIFRFASIPPAAGTVYLRVASAIPLIAAASYAAAGSETWTGPDRALYLPVLYAMSMVSGAKVDDRQDHTRYSTTQAMNGITEADLQSTMSMWMGQFELELLEQSRPYPPARD
jgi:hypothetical protein